MERYQRNALRFLMASGLFLSLANAIPGFDEDKDSYACFTAAGVFSLILVLAEVACWHCRRVAAVQPEAEAVSEARATIANSPRESLSVQDLPQHQAAGTGLLPQNENKQEEDPPFAGEPAGIRLKRMPESKPAGIVLVASSELPLSSVTAGMPTSEHFDPQPLRPQTINAGLVISVRRTESSSDSSAYSKTPATP